MDYGLEKYIGLVVKSDKRISLIKVPEPIKIIQRRGSNITGVLTKKRACDFIGWLEGGQAVYLEAKATKSPRRWTLDNRLRSHQLDWLIAADKMGALACVLVRRATGSDYLLPVSGEGLPFSGPSVLWDDLDPYKIPPRRSFVDLLIKRHGGQK